MAEDIYSIYEAIIGLEVHIQLLTKSKAFSSDKNEFGDIPNTNVSPVSLGHPGTLPVVNEKMFEFAVRLGLACKANINLYNEFARKNYFYADLPKGYQITQQTTPICAGGYIPIEIDGQEKNINLTRIHMEEDSGKSIHDQDPFNTLIDLNRAGTPLLEIVSEPDFRSGKEAHLYLAELRKLVRYLEISDGNMEEGSLRCDANISVRPKGANYFGTRTEVKNLNSFSHVEQAINYEIKRQIKLIENGGKVVQETRGYDPVKGVTFVMRTKEEAEDYRYFPEPDLMPVMLEQGYIEDVRKELPPLPNELRKKYIEQYGLSDYDSRVITENKHIALYFEELLSLTRNYKAAANWVMVNIKSYLNQNAVEIQDFPVKPEQIAEMIAMIDKGEITHNIASKIIFPELIKKPGKTPSQIAEEQNLMVENDTNEMKQIIEGVLAKFPAKVEEYKKGKKGLIGLFMGEIMKATRGKANPREANKILNKLLNK